MNDDIDKLAAEEATELLSKLRVYGYGDKVGENLLPFLPDSQAGEQIKAIIKTACGKAYSQGWHEGVRQCARKQQIEKERAAATSEQLMKDHP